MYVIEFTNIFTTIWNTFFTQSKLCFHPNHIINKNKKILMADHSILVHYIFYFLIISNYNLILLMYSNKLYVMSYSYVYKIIIL